MKILTDSDIKVLKLMILSNMSDLLISDDDCSVDLEAMRLLYDKLEVLRKEE